MSTATASSRPPLRIGVLRLTDTAPVIVAHEFGFFADAGVDVEIHVEPSWANIADKLAFERLDAAVIVPPLAFAIELGLRGAAQPMIVPYAISSGGNTLTVARDLADAVQQREEGEGLTRAEAFAAVLRQGERALGVVHPYSTHNLMLRYWLAAAGIEAGRDFKLVVVPPARAVEALRAGHVAGFCAGAPWGKVAERTGLATTIATSSQIWKAAPEKVFAVRGRWADAHPHLLDAALRALLRASKFCDAAENASYIAALLSRRQYLNVAGHAILPTLPGGAVPAQDVAVFHRHAATFPWRSHAAWFLAQMQRWALLPAELPDLTALAARVYRPDLYRRALPDEPAPVSDWKDEGAHAEAWLLPAGGKDLPMAADSFCDGVIFRPGNAR